MVISYVSPEWQLLAKFPEFKPTWAEEVQLKWFEDFEKLRRLFSPTPKESE